MARSPVSDPIATYLDEERSHLMRLKMEIINNLIATNLIRPWIKANAGRPLSLIKPDIGKQDRILLHDGGKMAAFTHSHSAANLEQVGKIGRKYDFDTNMLPPIVIIPDGQPLVATAIPQEAGSAKMNEIMAERELTFSSKRSGLVRSQVSVALSSRSVDDNSIGRLPLIAR